MEFGGRNRKFILASNWWYLGQKHSALSQSYVEGNKSLPKEMPRRGCASSGWRSHKNQGRTEFSGVKLSVLSELLPNPWSTLSFLINTWCMRCVERTCMIGRNFPWRFGAGRQLVSIFEHIYIWWCSPPPMTCISVLPAFSYLKRQNSAVPQRLWAAAGEVFGSAELSSLPWFLRP